MKLNKAWVALFWVVVFWLTAQILSVSILQLLCWNYVTELIEGNYEAIPNFRTKLHIVYLIGHSVGFVLLPLFYMYRINPGIRTELLKNKDSKITFMFLLSAVFLILSAMPSVALLADINRYVLSEKIIGSWHHVFNTLEESMMKQTILIVSYDSALSAIMVTLVIAVLPAIGEELIFRGLLQNEFIHISGNKHLAVWVSAFVFSFIHFQFYGFLPRMFLGVLLGYSYLLSGNILVSMGMHFTNNFIAMIAMNIALKNNQPIPTTDSAKDIPIYIIILSVASVFTIIMLLFRMHRKYFLTHKNNSEHAHIL
ncbi:MAG: CPBP family intramembrane metalloprotease [Cytophagaceae bacterium]|nr:CPBP family intramembrane metalloprotease [Cytophagaceae bacterium]MDW8456613.1 CPBP family intramembrane glutamic endopeptidase [Cytophagaceae bacterium]